MTRHLFFDSPDHKSSKRDRDLNKSSYSTMNPENAVWFTAWEIKLTEAAFSSYLSFCEKGAVGFLE